MLFRSVVRRTLSLEDSLLFFQVKPAVGNQVEPWPEWFEPGLWDDVGEGILLVIGGVGGLGGVGGVGEFARCPTLLWIMLDIRRRGLWRLLSVRGQKRERAGKVKASHPRPGGQDSTHDDVVNYWEPVNSGPGR